MRFASTTFLPLLLSLHLAACGQDEPRTVAPQPAESVPQVSDAPAKTDTAEDQAPKSAPVTNARPAQKATPAAPAEQTATGDAKMAPTPATVLRETELKDKPFIDAKTLKRLPVQSAITIVDREGGWLRVVSAGQQGWVRLLHVSSQPGGRASSAQELESAAKIVTGRAGGDNIVSTTGIRGLSEEQLRKAEPNPAELQRMESYGVTKEQAQAYARKHKLERRQVAQLPAPR
jgi:hypothetical protein